MSPEVEPVLDVLDPPSLLAEDIKRIPRRYKNDPLGFVKMAWPWGVEGGPLATFSGPDDNQTKFLEDLGRHAKERAFNGSTPVAPIRMSISSAHGTGKSSLGAMIGWWILCTRPMSIGTVTAGTYQQLEERTWADMMHWGRMCIVQLGPEGPQFDIQASGIFHADPTKSEKWKVTPKTAIDARAQTFAGQHAATSTSWFLFDEASEVPEGVWTVAYGGLTDGESMFFAYGQMLRNAGEFYNVCFGDAATRWDTRVFDGRSSAFTNKILMAEWAEEWGEDSDRYRVRVLGLPPRASELQFIGQGLIDGARRRDHVPLDDEPLVWGYDAANGGLAKHVFWPRRGLDGKSLAPIYLPGDTHRDAVVAKAAELLDDQRPGRKAAAMFGDQAFGAVILQRLKALGHSNVFEVNFGDSSPDKHQLNMRAFMWFRMKEWLGMGSIPDDHKIYQSFMDPGFHHRNGKLVLESKEEMAKRRVKSPDGPDALALTFAQNVPRVTIRPKAPPPPSKPSPYGWMG